MINEADEPPDVDGYKLIGGRTTAARNFYGEPLSPRAVMEILAEDFRGRRSIWIPAIVFQLYKTRRARTLEDATAVIKFYQAYRPSVSLDRTSEIFITGQTRGGRLEKRRLRFYPLYKDSYVSHLTLRRASEELIEAVEI